MTARLTGVSETLIRAWEIRHRAVEPERTATKRRLYSDGDIERLRLLKKLTDAGHAISQVARLPESDLRALLGRTESRAPATMKPQGTATDERAFLDAALQAVRDLDGVRFNRELKSAAAVLGVQGVLVRVIAPLAETVGEWWRIGAITAAHEHFSTAMTRTILHEISSPYAGNERAPVIVVGTPAGQLHEIGALMAGAAAASVGWRVVQLGASLPAAEIAAAARQMNARAVALSVAYPVDDPTVSRELRMLRELLPANIAIIVGGRAFKGYLPALEEIRAFTAQELSALGEILDHLREPTGGN